MAENSSRNLPAADNATHGGQASDLPRKISLNSTQYTFRCRSRTGFRKPHRLTITSFRHVGFSIPNLTAINPAAVNQALLAFVRVTNSASGVTEKAFEDFVRQEPNILECHDTSGEDSYLLKIRTDCAASLRALLGRIRDFPDVERTVASVSLCTIKE
jgi:Lrp/AsnC ligand binding domain